MSIIKQKIKLNRLDKNITIPLFNKNGINGYQQAIDQYTQIKSNSLINGFDDGEVTKFKIENYNYKFIVSFLFDSINSSIYLNRYPLPDVSIGSTYLINSYYIIDYFNNFDLTNQNLIFRDYFTKLDNNTIVSFQADPKSEYNITKTSQLSTIYVPNNYINSVDNDNVTLYMRVSFFNSFFGVYTPLYNEYNENSSNESKLYYTVTLNKINKSFTIDAMNSELKFKQFEDSQYVNKINNSFDAIDNFKLNYPDGSVFNYQTGNYS